MSKNSFILLLLCPFVAAGQTVATTNKLGSSGVTSILSTTSANHKLVVSGAIKQYGTGLNVVGSPTLFLHNTTASTGRQFGINASNAGVFQIFDVNASNAPRFVINGSGSVGIGTTNPQSTLDVNGDVRMINLRMNNGSNGITANCLSTHIYNNCGSAGYITMGFKTSSGANTSTADIFTIQQTNNAVGIRNNKPTEALDVIGNVKATGIILPTGAGAGKVLASDASGNATWQTLTSGTASAWNYNGNSVGGVKSIGTTDNFDLSFITNAAQRMRISAAGNLLLGDVIDNTNDKFQMSGNMRVGNYAIFNNSVAIGDQSGMWATGQGITGGGAYTPLYIGGTNQGWASAMIEMGCAYQTLLKDIYSTVNEPAIVRIGAGWGSVNTNDLSASTLAIQPTINISAGSGTTIRGVYYNPTVVALGGTHIAFQNTLGNNIFNSTSGNTLIGTVTDNGGKLQVNGSIVATGIKIPTGAAPGKVLTSDANGVATWQSAAGGSSSSSWATSGNNVYNANTGLVTIGGNINPAPTDATIKLAVKGTIYTQKLKVTQTGWADYVFDADYPLPGITEVATFIKNNRRLPEVPSANEVEKNGIDLGDNQVLLLKKIEELTLYLIKEHEELEKLKKIVEENAKQKHK